MENLVIFLAVSLVAIAAIFVGFCWRTCFDYKDLVHRQALEIRRLAQLLTAYKLADREPVLGPQYIGPGPYAPEIPDLDAPDIGPMAHADAVPADANPEVAAAMEDQAIETAMLGDGPVV